MADEIERIRWEAFEAGEHDREIMNGQSAEIERLTTELDLIRKPARALIMATTPFYSALELSGGYAGRTDGEGLHRDLREALGISKQEWRDSPER